MHRCWLAVPIWVVMALNRVKLNTKSKYSEYNFKRQKLLSKGICMYLSCAFTIINIMVVYIWQSLIVEARKEFVRLDHINVYISLSTQSYGY
jgi:hypothetical protein